MKWWEHAACREVDPDSFFPTSHAPHNTAEVRARLCEGCPVKLDCLEEAIASPDRPYGAWGNLSESEVLRLWRARQEAQLDLRRAS